MQLQKGWYSLKVSRLKSHYQIDAAPYPNHSPNYSIQLAEDIGTALLSQHDYDYEFIANKCIKFTHDSLCLSFELNQKKHFYKFAKKTNKGENTPPPAHHEPPLSPPVRKTVFAIENEELELKKQQGRPRFLTQEI